jgi:hypothetical protein
MLAFAFGCVCSDLNQQDENNNRRTSNNRANNGSEEPEQDNTAVTNTSGKSRKKGNTRAETTRKSETPDNGDFLVEYVDVEDEKYSQINEEIRSEKVMETVAKDLNKALALPHDITLVTRDCGMINAFYNPQDRSITLCYEIMDFYFQLFQKAGGSKQEANQNMLDAMQFIFLHELGHALIDAYKLPVAGREEDAADQLSSYINLKELGDQGSRSAIAAADAFGMQAQLADSKELPFYDEHSLDQQRFYNILCALYGSNPGKYTAIVSRGLLPEARAVRCQNEYQKIVESWDTLLKPYRKQ